eukprot:TRINITY_DN8193_c0_g1_i2.p2 TRINITY_DN8193_c0_g1~~TRINITY_DN8193_c0_g1_i2.p2  ORF type:complete len:188 (+),score=35.50 TRINITY_DN8193_c0_g1_i2:536-1099(+)
MTKYARNLPLNKQILQNLSQFQAKNKLNTAFLTFIATYLLTQQEKTEAMKAFQSMDKNGDGLLSKQELVQGYNKLYHNMELSTQAVDKIMKEFGVEEEDNIDYTQFVMATLNKNQILTKDKIEQAFKILDIDGNGVISRYELEQIMGGTQIPEIVWRYIINEIDVNQDGEIQYTEFVSLLLQQMDFQ